MIILIIDDDDGKKIEYKRYLKEQSPKTLHLGVRRCIVSERRDAPYYLEKIRSDYTRLACSIHSWRPAGKSGRP